MSTCVGTKIACYRGLSSTAHYDDNGRIAERQFLFTFGPLMIQRDAVSVCARAVSGGGA